MTVAAILGVLGVAGAGPAMAASDQALLQALSRCAAVSSDAARLACYDGLAPRLREAAAAQGQGTAAQPAPQVAAAPTKQEEKSWFGFDMGDLFGSSPSQQTTPAQFGAENTAQAQQQRAHAEQALDSITAKLADYAYNPFGKFIVTLENGQIWKQLPADDARAHFARDPAANTVKIERGALGSYLLSVDGQNRSYRVTRIK